MLHSASFLVIVASDGTFIALNRNCEVLMWKRTSTSRIHEFVLLFLATCFISALLDFKSEFFCTRKEKGNIESSSGTPQFVNYNRSIV